MTTGGTWLGRATLLARTARLFLICLALFVGSADVQAGDISTRRTDRCDVKFSGDIEDGDAAKLVAALKAVDTSSAPAKRLRNETELGYFQDGLSIARLCLDSPGGSFAEAVTFLKKTLTRVSYASVIEPLAECNSACALIFLGAHLNSGDGYFEAYRLLDVSGQLGFHAPYVAPSETQIVDPAIVGRSYREGVEAVADLLDLNPILFPRSLLAEFLRVGPDQFLKIDEVGQMAAWDIGLTGYRRPTAITEKQMEHVCSNQRMRSDPQIYSVISSFEPEPEPASDPIPLSEKMVVRSEQTVEGVAGCTVRARLYGDVLFLLADTTSSEAGEAPAQNDGEGDIFTLKSLADDISPVDPDSYTPAYFLFEPSTKVRTLKGRPVAATQTTASPEATPGAAVPQVTLWNHNGSTMRLEANAGTLSMTYEIPREAMLQVGVRKGDNLFTCSRDGSKLSCTTRIFHPRCGKHDFAAVGIMSDDEKNIRIRGNAPGLDSECNESGRRPQDWAFTYLSPAE